MKEGARGTPLERFFSMDTIAQLGVELTPDVTPGWVLASMYG